MEFKQLHDAYRDACITDNQRQIDESNQTLQMLQMKLDADLDMCDSVHGYPSCGESEAEKKNRLEDWDFCKECAQEEFEYYKEVYGILDEQTIEQKQFYIDSWCEEEAGDYYGYFRSFEEFQECNCDYTSEYYYDGGC